MPGKQKSMDQDEYESDDLENTETLISRNRPLPVPRSRKTQSAKKKSSRRPGTPKRKRAQSAPPSRNGRELWMTAVKNRQTAGLIGPRHPESPRHKTPSEYWVDTLRKTGIGISTESTGMNTFSGLKRPNEMAIPYLSTSSFMRQMMGTEKGRKMEDPTVKSSSGTPAYKSQEEYYDQVLELKKYIANLNQESATMKAKIRRLEEDNQKKEKEMAALLDPQKSEELRRTLADKRPDSGAVIHSLKQKILKLEMQLRDKENAHAKLQSDLKTTKIEEMKSQMEAFYQEIVRLQHSKDTGMDRSARTGKEGTAKVRALNETILRLNKTNEQLQIENRSLKEDLKKSLDDTKDIPSKEYEDMNRKELIRTIMKLDKNLQRAEKKLETGSLASYDSRTEMQGKIQLEGSLEERLEQLDKRETELLEELEKQKKLNKALQEEKRRHRKRLEEADQDVDVRSDRGSQRPPSARSPQSSSRKASISSRPPSARSTSVDSKVSSVRRQKIETFKENRAAKKIQRGWRAHRQQKQEEKVLAFQQNRAARRIQNQWTQYKYHKNEEEVDEAAELIGAALQAHCSRQNRMQYYESDTESMATTDYDDDVALLQSAFRGHQLRKRNIEEWLSRERDDDDESIITPRRPSVTSSARSRPQSAKSRSSIASKASTAHSKPRSYIKSSGSLAATDDDDDDF
ncbi:hypothetical protein CHS0354_005710 [Potamilus streckersoni]|uniref:IQ domain-containing protein E-like n=1 Tax=Potamilus streckersoni TaxID=2493646 RepID=A0AAE0RW45_9BIVA|nr:hypothetical protein CHS0354_005710 [Potamilus streckersoni]